MAASSPTVRYLLVWLDSHSSIGPRELARIRCKLEDGISQPRENVQVDLWLESPGGDAHTAYKLALMLRKVASHIRVVVPDYAKSAATLLALAADELFLAPGAELGPLDAQVHEEGSLFGGISALSIAHAADAVARDAVALAIKGATEIISETNMGRVDAFRAMLDFSASFSAPLVSQLDPRLVYQANELLRVTVRYATILLTPTVGARQAAEIAKELVEQFPTHGFVIAHDEASRLGLPVKPIREYDHLKDVRACHRAAEAGTPLVEFGPLKNFLTEENKEPRKERKKGGDNGQNGAAGEGLSQAVAGLRGNPTKRAAPKA